MVQDGVLAPGYMRRFHCIGGACEASCCQWWRIDIDRDNYKKLKNTMARTAEDREKFRKSVKRNRTEANRGNSFAKIVLDEKTRFCPFVDSKGLCEIHGRFGEDYLSFTCRTYPRRLVQIFDRLTVGAVLSCPEAARQCLLAPDSTSLEVLGTEEFKSAGLALGALCDNAADPYCRYVNEIRDILLQFLSARQYPVTWRLFFVAYLSNRISKFFYKGMPAASFDEGDLAAEVERLGDPGMLADLGSRYQKLEASTELPLKFVNSVLSAKEADSVSGGLFQDVFEFYGLNGANWDDFLSEDKDVSSVVAKKVIDAYTLRRDRVRSLFSSRLEIYFENFCKNHLLIFLYTDFPSLLAFIENMVFRLSIGAFLLFSHPNLGDLLEDPSIAEKREASEESKKILDAVVVESFFKFSRSIEHDKLLWESLNSAMRDGDLSGLPYIVQLLKFIDEV